jgi:hypothetical protein
VKGLLPVQVLVICLCLALSPGCGYHVRASGEPIGISIPSLAIPMMTSTSSYLGFEAQFTRVVRQEFVSRAKVPLVSREEASAVLIGKIYDIRTEPLTYTVVQTPAGGSGSTYTVEKSVRYRIKLDAKLLDRTTGKIIWEDKNMEEKSSFQVGEDPLVTRYNEEVALQEMARRLAQRIYAKTMERF